MAETQAERSGDFGFRSLLTVAALVIVIAGLKAASAILLPVLVAVFLAVLSLPPIATLVKRGAPPWAAALIVLIVVVLMFSLVSVYVGASIISFTDNMPTYQKKITAQNVLQPISIWLTKSSKLNLNRLKIPVLKSEARLQNILKCFPINLLSRRSITRCLHLLILPQRKNFRNNCARK